MSPERSPLDGQRRSRLADLPRRVYLTYRYRGFSAVIYQTLIFPLRLTPLDRVLRLGPGRTRRSSQARSWYRRHGRPVTIVIPSFRDAELVAALVTKLRQTTPSERIRVIVTDDGSGPEHLAALRVIQGIDVVAGEHNGGFSVNVNRALRIADPSLDVVLLNSDVLPLRGWLESLQHETARNPNTGIVAAKLLYPDNRIQYAGTVRNHRAPEWFDHRYRFKASDWGPADVGGPTLAATGACMYLTRQVLDQVGLFDEGMPMGYEDVDYCLRAWQAGYQVSYAPAAQLHHHESITRGTEVGERERASQHAFWRRWASFFDERSVLTDDGKLRVVYVTEDTVIGGGHRVIFEQLNGLARRGHNVQLWTLGDEPDWFALECPVRSFADYAELESTLAPLDAVKVATWWNSAIPVWRASVVNGLPVYLVQDIETSYYRDAPEVRDAVLDSYRPEFRYLTTSSWNREQLTHLGLETEVISPGVDLDVFHPLPTVPRQSRMALALGRSNPLKNLPLTLKAWRRLSPRPELCLFGTEPELASESGVRYVTSPSDTEVNTLLNQATAFVQTSVHEGFCLPILEAMATGAPVVCTDAHGNRDFCRDAVNCLMSKPTATAVATAMHRIMTEPQLAARLGQAGIETATAYAWPERIAALERFLYEVARPRRIEPTTDAVPAPRRRRDSRDPPRPGERCG